MPCECYCTCKSTGMKFHTLICPLATCKPLLCKRKAEDLCDCTYCSKIDCYCICHDECVDCYRICDNVACRCKCHEEDDGTGPWSDSEDEEEENSEEEEEEEEKEVAVSTVEEKVVVAKTYPTIQELQAEFQKENPGVYFKNDPSLSIEIVYNDSGIGMSTRAQSAWSNFLENRAYKILAKAGMWSQRLDSDMTCQALTTTNSLDVRKWFLGGYIWYTTALYMLSNTTMPIEWGGRSRETAFYREAARKQRAGEKEYDSDEDDEDEDDSYEDSDEEDEEEEEEEVVAIPTVQEKKVVAIPTIEEQIDALRRLRYNLQRLSV